VKAQKNDNLKNHKNVLNDFKIRKKTFQNEKKGETQQNENVEKSPHMSKKKSFSTLITKNIFKIYCCTQRR